MLKHFEPSQGSPIRVCHACGCLTPDEIPYCLECGALTPEMVEEQKFAHFVQAVFLRKSPYSYIFFGINILVFVLMVFAGSTTDPAIIRAFGAKQNALIYAGEIWRLVTPTFLHIGIIHLAFNNYALWVLGPQLESLYGSARFVVIYLLSGIACSAASFFYSNGLSAGASGSLFGLFGVLAVFALKYKGEIPEILRQMIKKRVYPLIVLNLLLTFGIPQIDKAGHVGGLLAGAFAAWVIPYARPEERKTKPVWVVAQILMLTLVVASFAAVIWRYDGPRFSLSAIHVSGNIGFWEDEEGPTWRFASAIEESEALFKKVQATLWEAKLSPAAMIKVQSQNLVAQRLLETAPRVDRSLEADRVQFSNLLKEQTLLFDGRTPQQLIELNQKFDPLKQKINSQLEKDYGIVFTTDPVEKK